MICIDLENFMRRCTER